MTTINFHDSHACWTVVLVLSPCLTYVGSVGPIGVTAWGFTGSRPNPDPNFLTLQVRPFTSLLDRLTARRAQLVAEAAERRTPEGLRGLVATAPGGAAPPGLGKVLLTAMAGDSGDELDVAEDGDGDDDVEGDSDLGA